MIIAVVVSRVADAAIKAPPFKHFSSDNDINIDLNVDVDIYINVDIDIYINVDINVIVHIEHLNKAVRGGVRQSCPGRLHLPV